VYGPVEQHESERAMKRSPIANELNEVGELLPEEQSELALKLSYGIGLAELIGSADHQHQGPPVRVRGREVEQVIKAPAPQRTDAEIRARAAAMGVTCGRRGQWIR
jgi:hypothetical protein